MPQTITIGIGNSTVGVSPYFNRVAFQRVARSLLWGRHRRRKGRQRITLPQRVSGPPRAHLIKLSGVPSASSPSLGSTVREVLCVSRSFDLAAVHQEMYPVFGFRMPLTSHQGSG